MIHTQENISHQPLNLPAGITHNVPLADKNWFKIGGSARYFAQPTTPNEFADALLFAQMHNLAMFVLGDGANILISDEGFDGLVIHPAISSIAVKNSGEELLLTAGAGVGMPDLINYCLDHNIVGLEEFSGIPGTIGGSVFINLHYFQFFLADFLVGATVIHRLTGDLLTVDKEWFKFGYNVSTLHTHDYYLVDATFKLTAVSDVHAAFARGRQTEIIRHRTSRYPAKNTCGSFFRNFLPHEVTLESNGKKMIYTAYYLDKIGAKGTLSVGGAHVSYQHANMLVTTAGATSTDVINLARALQEKVHEQFGVVPQPECRLIGFKEYPLL